MLAHPPSYPVFYSLPLQNKKTSQPGCTSSPILGASHFPIRRLASMKRGRGAVLWARLSLQRRDGSRSLALVSCSAVGAGCALAKRRRLLPPKAQTGRPQDPPVEAQRKARIERKQSAEEAAGSPRSLQFALFGVSSADTSRVLHALRGLPLELRHLNRTGADGASSCGVRTAARVFGWHNWLLQEDARRSSRVIWKSAKAMEGASIQRLARKLWATEDDQDVDVLCTISGVARVVRSADRAYAVRDRCQVWVECLFDFGHQICIAKKELRQFGDYRVQDMAMSECQGFLVRPTVTRIRNEMIAGSMLQCLRAVDPRSEQAPSDLVDRIMSDLPRFTLQWEDAFVNDLFPPMPLFDQAFDW